MHDNTKRDSPSSPVSLDAILALCPPSLSRSAAQGGSPVGAAQAPSRDHRRFHNAALTRSAINESVETVGQKNTLLRGDHHGAQGGSKLRPTEENETAYTMMAEEYLDIVNLRWKSVTDFLSFSFFVIVMKLW